MLPKQEVIAMILAGGQGSRLGVLTKSIAKPAVPYGGKYRIIDFPLSNCVNSGIETVGVLTQYQPLELNEYIGSGQPWDLDGMNAGVRVLPPYQRSRKSDWYKGTANAIYQNIPYIERYSPEYVVILSGDHIYKMDYSKMLAYHREHEADVTIAVLPVPMKEASRFGIMNTDERSRILEFEEKPAQPKSNLASMGIYIFNWKQLRKILTEDMKDEASSHDFGKDIIPSMLAEGRRLFAWRFEGYWKDVGTIDSLWEANMDLLDPDDPLDLSDPSWKIYTEDISTIPHFVGAKARLRRAYVNQGCVIEGTVENSVLFTNVEVAGDAVITDSVLMPDVEVSAGAQVRRCIVMAGVKIGAGAVVGDPKSEHITLISKNVRGESDV